MREVGNITPKIIDHWEQYLAQCEVGAERAKQQLSRLAIESSGQLQLELEQTKKGVSDDCLQDKNVCLLPSSDKVS